MNKSTKDFFTECNKKRLDHFNTMFIAMKMDGKDTLIQGRPWLSYDDPWVAFTDFIQMFIVGVENNQSVSEVYAINGDFQLFHDLNGTPFIEEKYKFGVDGKQIREKIQIDKYVQGFALKYLRFSVSSGDIKDLDWNHLDNAGFLLDLIYGFLRQYRTWHADKKDEGKQVTTADQDNWNMPF